MFVAPERRPVRDLPYHLMLTVLANVIIWGAIAALGYLFMAMAQGSVPSPTSPDFPWVTVIQAIATVLVAVFTWLVKNQVSRVHETFNSKMDALLLLTANAAKAEGVLEGKRQQVEIQQGMPPVERPFQGGPG